MAEPDQHDGVAWVLRVQRELAKRFEPDAVQQVLTVALEAAQAGRRLELSDAEQLARQFTSDERRAVRNVRDADAAEIPDGATPKPSRRRQARAPSFPRGALPAMFASQTGDKPSQHAVVLPMEVSDLPTPELVRAMGEIIHHVFTPALQGLPSPPEQQAAIFSFYEELFGHAVEQTWGREYLLLIEEAKRRRLEHRANAAIRNQDAHAASAAAGNRLMSPEQVLKAAREVTNLNPESCRMPAYADDPELVAWLIARMGFEGGGGRAAMTSRRLKELVLDPAALADAIDRFADRLAERLRDRPDEPDDNGELCEPEAQWGRDRLTQLAARVRERGALVARPVRPSSEHQRPPKYAPRTRNDAPNKRGSGGPAA